MMPIIIKCHSCGFVFYNDHQLKSIDEVLRYWGYHCPVCGSPLSRTPLRIFVGGANIAEGQPKHSSGFHKPT